MGDEADRSKRDPRRDKQNSLTKDSRKVPGTSPSLTRSGAHKIKTQAHRADRHAAKHELAEMDTASEASLDQATSNLTHNAHREPWVKTPSGTTLSEAIEQKRADREDPEAAWESKLHG